MTSQQPYWCSKPILLELKLFSYVKARIDVSHESENTLYRLLFFSVVKTTEANRALKLYFVLNRILK